jgi:hypothetical protein
MLYNILKIAELDCCQIIILSIYVVACDTKLILNIKYTSEN